MKLRRGKFRNRHTPRYVEPGYKLNSVREEIEYYGTPVYFGWQAVPAGLVSESKAKRLKLAISDEPVAYCEDAFHWLTALYKIQEASHE